MRRFLHIILLFINILFAIGMLLSTLAGSIAPSHFAGISILSYGYFILLLVNILFIIFWLCLSRWTFLVSLAAILLRYAFVPLFFQLGGTTEVEDPDNEYLKIMTFNTHGFGGLDNDTLMTTDSGAVMFLSILDEEQPDVVCLQEFFQPRQISFADSMEHRGFHHYYGVRGKSLYSPIILFSRCPITMVHDMDNESKFYVNIQKGEHQARVCVVHLDSYQLTPEDQQGFEKLTHAKPDSSTNKILKKFTETTRSHELEWKEDLLPLIEKTTDPLIIVGDFNDTPASYIYQQATDHLVDSYVEQGRGLGTTYHGPYPAYRIDYILHSDDMEAVSYKRIKSNISDHYPIMAQLKFK